MGQPLGGGIDTASLITTAALPAGQTNAGPSQQWGLAALAAANAASPAIAFYGSFNITIWGTFSATAQLQKSYDGGTTWLPISADAQGDVLAFTAPCALSWTEVESNVVFRLQLSAYASGSVNYRLSQASVTAFTFDPFLE